MSQYDEFVANYHWLYSDYVSSGKAYLEEHDDLLKEAGPQARILDCSCGIGTLPIALARLGYAVSGSDASPGMIEQAAIAAKRADVEFPLTCCAWEDLPTRINGQFDLIFCLGNSIGHCRSADEMLRSLQGMRAALASGGKLAIQSTNWEQIRKVKKRFTHYSWRQRAGLKCLPIYVWNFPEKFDDAHTIEVLLIFDRDGEVSTQVYPIVYNPFSVDDLTERLRNAGFTKIQIKFSENQPAYRVVAS